MDGLRSVIVPRLQGACQLGQATHRVRLQQVFIVQVVKEDVQSFLGVVDLDLEGCGSTRFHSSHVRGKYLEDRLSSGWDVGSVARR